MQKIIIKNETIEVSAILEQLRLAEAENEKLKSKLDELEKRVKLCDELNQQAMGECLQVSRIHSIILFIFIYI